MAHDLMLFNFYVYFINFFFRIIILIIVLIMNKDKMAKLIHLLMTLKQNLVSIVIYWKIKKNQLLIQYYKEI